MEDRIDFGVDLLTGCLLPQLVHELGFQQVDEQHFDEFRRNLDQQLIVLFDFVQKNEDLLTDVENNTLEFRLKFILLLCEQTATGTLFQTPNKIFLKNLHCLIGKHFNLINNEALQQKVLNYYKEHLKTSNWKVNLGSTYSFEQFCKLFYVQQNHYLNADSSMFLLSVGALFEEFHELEFKEMAIRIFNIILDKTTAETVQDINIHNLIYDIAFKNISRIKSKTGIIELSNCICKCIKLLNIKDYSKWNKIDDLINEIFQRIAFESNADVVISLIVLIANICLVSASNRISIDECIILDDFNLLDFRIISLRNKIQDEFMASYRWVKKLLQLFIAESNRLLGNWQIACRMLYAIHVTYLVCVYPIPLKILKIHLLEFFEKMSSIFMEVLSINKNVAEIKIVIRGIFETFVQQMQNGGSDVNNEISNYKIAMEKFLNYDF